MAKPPRLPPPQEPSRPDWTPGRVLRAEALPAPPVDRQQERPRVVSDRRELPASSRVEKPEPISGVHEPARIAFDPKLVAPLSESARADLMSRSEREAWQQSQSDPEANRSRSFEKVLTESAPTAAWWGIQQLPFVSKAMRIGELVNDAWSAVTSDDPIRETAGLFGRESGRMLGERLSRVVGNRGKDSAADESEGDSWKLGETVVDHVADYVTEKGGQFGEHVAETLVDTYRDQPIATPRDERGQFRPLTSEERGMNQLKREDAHWLRRASFALGNETGQLLRGGLEAAGLPAPSEGSIAATAYLSSGLPYSGGVRSITTPGEAWRDAGKLRDQIDEGARPGEVAAILKEQLTAQREANQIMRNMGARPTSSAAYVE